MDERELELRSGTVVLRGAVVRPAGGARAPLAVLCHGIPAGAPSTGEPGYEALARRLAEGGSAACYFNFRGTGLSGGDFSLRGWAADLEALLAAAREARGAFEGCDPARMALMGFSGGGAVSIVCAARRAPLAGVAAISSPADFSVLLGREDMAGFIAHARAIGIIRDPAFPPSEEEYYREMLAMNPIKHVGAVSPTPLLVVHGDEDETVPVAAARRLYEAASPPRELHVVKGGGHKLRLNAEAMEVAVGWIWRRLGLGPAAGAGHAGA